MPIARKVNIPEWGSRTHDPAESQLRCMSAKVEGYWSAPSAHAISATMQGRIPHLLV